MSVGMTVATATAIMQLDQMFLHLEMESVTQVMDATVAKEAGLFVFFRQDTVFGFVTVPKLTLLP